MGGVVGSTYKADVYNTYNAGTVTVGTCSVVNEEGCLVGGATDSEIANSYYNTSMCKKDAIGKTSGSTSESAVAGKTTEGFSLMKVSEAFSSEAGVWTNGERIGGDGFVAYKFPYLTAFGASSQLTLSPAIELDNKAMIVHGATTTAVDIPSNSVFQRDIIFDRSFPNLNDDAYFTIMLPFEPINSPEGVTFYEFNGISEDEGKLKVAVVKLRDAILANTPYLVKVSSKVDNIKFPGGGQFKATAGEHSVTRGNWKFVGTYEYKTWEEGDAGLGKTYGFAGSTGNDPSMMVGKFAKVGAGAYIYPMRAYLEYDAPAAARPAANGAKPAVASLPDEIEVVVVDKDEVTGEETTKVIGSLDTRTGEIKFASDRWYDLNGRYLGVKKPTQKGTYYNNGKKVVVK